MQRRFIIMLHSTPAVRSLGCRPIWCGSLGKRSCSKRHMCVLNETECNGAFTCSHGTPMSICSLDAFSSYSICVVFIFLIDVRCVDCRRPACTRCGANSFRGQFVGEEHSGAMETPEISFPEGCPNGRLRSVYGNCRMIP